MVAAPAAAAAKAMAMAVHHTVIYRTNRIQSFISDLYIGSIYHFYSVCMYWKCHAESDGMTVFSFSPPETFQSRGSMWNFVKFSGLECFRRNKADDNKKSQPQTNHSAYTNTSPKTSTYHLRKCFSLFQSKKRREKQRFIWIQNWKICVETKYNSFGREEQTKCSRDRKTRINLSIVKTSCDPIKIIILSRK